MAVIQEAQALIDILSRAGNAVMKVRNNYSQASDELTAFPRKAKEFEEKRKRWEQLVKKYPLPPNSQVESRLKEAVDRFEKLANEVEKTREKTSCCIVWYKVTSPERIALRLNEVNEALDNILKDMKDSHEAQQIAEEQADKIKAPFDFTDDDKYVPIMSTVQKIKTCFEKDDSSHNMILLYGESGEGKSSLAKYITLMYYKESTLTPLLSGSPSCGFRDGIVFLRCGKKADSRSLLISMGKKLGYEMGAYDRLATDDLLKQEGENGLNQQQRTDVESLRGTLMERFKLLTSVLIILDDVWEQQVIQDLLIPVPSNTKVKYLVTTQDRLLWRNRVDCIWIGKPSKEEARKILANHMGLAKEIEFPFEVKDEVDSLLEDVAHHPLVLANLATVIPVRTSSVPGLPVWKKLRKELMDVLKIVDDTNRKYTPSAFDEPYKLNVLASLTMAFDQFTPQAQTLLHCLAMCSAEGVDEGVLKFWFKAINGRYSEFAFNLSSEEVKQVSFITVATTEDTGREELWTRWSMHDLRRQLIWGMKLGEIQSVLQKLTEGHLKSAGPKGKGSDADIEKLLSTALCFLYGNSACSEHAQSKLELHKNILSSSKMDWLRRKKKDFIKSFTKLLYPEYPECEMEWQKNAHAIARTVILQYLETGKFDNIDGEVSRLLETPETALDTCAALTSISWYYNLYSGALHTKDVLPRTERTLLEKIHMYSERPPQQCKELALYVKALERCVGVSEPLTLQEEPQISRFTTVVVKFLRWPWGNSPLKDDVGMAQSLLSMLWIVSSRGTSFQMRGKLASTPGLSEILLSFLDVRSIVHSDLHWWSSLAFLEIACQDNEIKAKTILLPNVLEVVVGMLGETHTQLHENAAHILKELAWTADTSEKIVSHPGALDGLLNLLESDEPGKVCAALQALAQLARMLPNRALVVSCWELVQRLVHQDAHLDVLREVATTVLSEGVGTTNRVRLAEIIEQYEKLLRDNVPENTRGEAMTALCIFASTEPTRELVVSHPQLLEHMLEGLREEGAVTSVLKAVYVAIQIVITESEQMEDERKRRLTVEFVHRCLQLTQSANTGVQLEAGDALKRLASAQQLYDVMVLDANTIIELFLDSVQESRNHSVVETLGKIVSLFLRTSRESEQKQEILKNVQGRIWTTFVVFLEDDTNPEMQKAVLQALVYLPNKQEPYSVFVGEAKILDRLVSFLNRRPEPSALVPLAWLIRNCLVREGATDAQKAQRLSFMQRFMQSYVALLADGNGANLQAQAALAIGILSIGKENLELIVTFPGALDSLVALLTKENATPSVTTLVGDAVQLIDEKGTKVENVDRIVSDFKNKIFRRYQQLLEDDVPEEVQRLSATALTHLLCSKTNSELFTSVCSEGRDNLTRVFNRLAGREARPWSARFRIMCCLTFLDQEKAEEMHLSSADAIWGRGYGKMQMKLSGKALADFDRAIHLSPSWKGVYSNRAFARAQLGNTAGALEDLNRSIEINRKDGGNWQERGILKRIMGDYDGALSDLNEGLKFDHDNYEILKHRSYVKFLMGDEHGARFDAEHALMIKHLRLYRYQPKYARHSYFGSMSVTFLEFDLL